MASVEYRSVMRFYFLLGKSADETFNNMQIHSRFASQLRVLTLQFLTPIKSKTPTPLPSLPALAWVENRTQISEAPTKCSTLKP